MIRSLVFVACSFSLLCAASARIGEKYEDFKARVGKAPSSQMTIVNGVIEFQYHHRKENIRIVAFVLDGKIAGEIYTDVTKAEAEVIMEQQAGGKFVKLRFDDNRIVWGVDDLHAFFDAEQKQLYVSTNAALEKIKGFAAWEAKQFKEMRDRAQAREKLKGL